MNRKILVILSLLAVIILAASYHKYTIRNQVKWRGGPDIETCDFYFGGSHLGKGRAGFGKLLHRMELFQNNHHVDIDFPPEMFAYYEENYGYFYYMPLMHGTEEMKQWNEMSIRKRLSFP